jgi:hypothetical protein
MAMDILITKISIYLMPRDMGASNFRALNPPPPRAFDHKDDEFREVHVRPRRLIWNRDRFLSRLACPIYAFKLTFMK